MSRLAGLMAVAAAAALVAGCSGTSAAGRAAPHEPAPAAGVRLACDRLPSVAATVSAMSRPRYSGLVRDSGIVASLATQVYRGRDADADLGNLLGEAATELGRAAVARGVTVLELAQDELQQALGMCPAANA